MSNVAAGYYSVISDDFMRLPGITLKAKLLYLRLQALAKTKGFCWASNRWLADLFNVSMRTVNYWISALKKVGLIFVSQDKNGTQDGRKIYVTSDERKIKACDTSGEEIVHKSSPIVHKSPEIVHKSPENDQKHAKNAAGPLQFVSRDPCNLLQPISTSSININVMSCRASDEKIFHKSQEQEQAPKKDEKLLKAKDELQDDSETCTITRLNGSQSTISLQEVYTLASQEENDWSAEEIKQAFELLKKSSSKISNVLAFIRGIITNIRAQQKRKGLNKQWKRTSQKRPSYRRDIGKPDPKRRESSENATLPPVCNLAELRKEFLERRSASLKNQMASSS